MKNNKRRNSDLLIKIALVIAILIVQVWSNILLWNNGLIVLSGFCNMILIFLLLTVIYTPTKKSSH